MGSETEKNKAEAIGSFFGHIDNPPPSFRRGLAEIFAVVAVTGLFGGAILVSGLDRSFSVLPDLRKEPPQSCDRVLEELKDACNNHTIRVAPFPER